MSVFHTKWEYYSDIQLKMSKGFIDNEGKNFLYSGYWKVYANVSEKVHIFNLFDNARKDIIKQIISGTAIEDIIANYQIELQSAAV